MCASPASALPPDVRRWLCPAVSNPIDPGYAPSVGLARLIHGPKAAPRA